MAFPSLNSILRGFFFIVTLLLYLLCERWMLEVKVRGTPNYQPHIFNHVFLLWTIKQCLMAVMYILWKAIEENWIGMGRFQHAEIDDGERRSRVRRLHSFNRLDSAQHDSVSEDLTNSAETDDSALIQPDPPRTALRPKKKSYTWLLFFWPSFFNQAHILLIYFGLKFTYPSSAMMLTGTSAVFVTILSLAFLVKQISSFMWVGVFFSAAGFAISGLSDYIHLRPPGYEPYGIAAGDLLYAMGQITMTTQMIFEEKYMRKHSIHPMKFLGSEGIYSMVFSFITLAFVCCMDTDYSDLPNNRYENIADAALQFANSWKVVVATFGSLISYVVFTYLGMILIKDHGAMSRIMIEALAWCLYWTILLSMKWEQYFITQIPGLVMVPVGVLIFSHIVRCPCSGGDTNLIPNPIDEFHIENDNAAACLDRDDDLITPG